MSSAMNLQRLNCVAIELNFQCEVAVAGAGIAGLAAAIVLAQANIDVVVFGLPARDELKAGESLPGAALRMLRRLGIENLAALLTADEYLHCTANCSSWGSEDWVYKDAIHNVEGGGWHLLRHRFEVALLAHACRLGVRYIPAQVNKLVSNSSGFQLGAKMDDKDILLEANWLIDGTGRNAWLTRRLVGRPQSYSDQFAAVAWIPSSQTESDNTTRIKSTSNGWWYSARLPHDLRVLAFHGLPRHIAQLMRAPQVFMQQAQLAGILPENVSYQTPPLAFRAYNAGVHLGSAVAGRGWIAVGDAAISFDPLSSQGMFFALYSGIRGAEAVVNSIHQTDKTRAILAEYSERVAQVFSTNERTRRMFYMSEIRYRGEEYWQRQCR
jgi:flavin-dependent dehydrogenase